MYLSASGLLLLSTSCNSISKEHLTHSSSEQNMSEVYAQDEESLLRNTVADVAKTYLGKPYKYGAKGPNAFDCSGFTFYVLRKFNIALLGSSKSQAKQGSSVSLTQSQPGDLLYFKNSKGRVNHIAIIINNTSEGIEVAHATTSRGVIVENISKSKYWKSKIAGVRSVVECRDALAAIR